MEKNNIQVLDGINKGATMGIDAISFIKDKVGDNNFKQVLSSEYKKYTKISDQVKKLYSKYSPSVPETTNSLNKIMTWYGIQFNTIKDQSNSKISELLIQGTNMGIIEGRKLLNQNPNLSSDVKQILNTFISMQENSIKTLKKYL